MVEDVQGRVLAAICAHASHVPSVEVNAAVLVAELGIMHYELYRSVIALSDQGLLDYLGAGPRVLLTPLGVSKCGQAGAPPAESAKR